jgi:hypothetical protein
MLYHLRNTPDLFCFSYFLDRAPEFLIGGQPQILILLPAASCVTVITNVNHHAQLVMGGGRSHVLPRLASNHEPPDRHLLSSWDYRYAPHVKP